MPQRIQLPYLDESQFHIKNWDSQGNLLVRNHDFIRLTANAPHQVSNMFSKWPIHAESFEMELTFHIHNPDVKHGLVGDRLAIWFWINLPISVMCLGFKTNSTDWVLC